MFRADRLESDRVAQEPRRGLLGGVADGPVAPAERLVGGERVDDRTAGEAPPRRAGSARAVWQEQHLVGVDDDEADAGRQARRLLALDAVGTGDWSLDDRDPVAAVTDALVAGGNSGHGRGYAAAVKSGCGTRRNAQAALAPGSTVQVVGYQTGSPALLLSDDGDVDAVALAPGTELSYALGDRRCAGTVRDDGHEPCDRSEAPYCEFHRSTWVCARCTGTCLKDEMDCDDGHAVYLAAFAPASFKVGVTREWRLETRLREQGADRAAHLRRVADGRIARRVEAGIAETVGDSVRVTTKLGGLGESVDETAWRALCDEFDPFGTWSLDYGLDLDGRPVAETLASGRVRGVKGRVLVLERDGTTYAVDLRDLVGHEVRRGGAGRSLQSSLGAF